MLYFSERFPQSKKIPITGYPDENFYGYIREKSLRIEIATDAKVPYDVHSCFNQMILNKSSLDEYILSSNKESTKLYEYLTYDTLMAVSKLFNQA